MSQFNNKKVILISKNGFNNILYNNNFYKCIPLSAKFPAGVQPNYSHKVQCFYSLFSLALALALALDLKKAHTLFGHIAKIHTNMRKKRVWLNWVVNRKSFFSIIFWFWLFILPVWWARFEISILWFSLFSLATLIVAETNKMGWIENVYFLYSSRQQNG